jgi:acyl-ACP thioesterase
LRNLDPNGSETSARTHLRERFRVPFHHADATGAASIVALAGYLQQAAGLHAERLGVGAERLMDDGLFWVLTRLFLRIRRAPRGGETIEIETWPSQRPRQLFLRDFRVQDETGAEIVTATSSWALIDAARRKAVKGPAWISQMVAFDETRATPFPASPPRQLDGGERSATVTPRWSDLDVNGHVNNANLVGWLLEAFDTDWLTGHTLTALDVAFRNECRREDTVQSCAAPIAQDSFAHALRRGDETEIARAQSWWR